MVDSHTIAAVTVTLIGVALFIRSMTAVVNAVTRLLQAASRLIMTAVALFKKTYCCTNWVHVVAGVFKKSSEFAQGKRFEHSKKRELVHVVCASAFLKKLTTSHLVIV